MIVRIAILMAVAVAHGYSQLSFEVASIKLSGPQSVRGSRGGPESRDPGEYRFGQVTLGELIAQAYGVDSFQISSAASLENQRFDLVAKLPPGATKPQFLEMLRTLLAERFHLKVHMQSKEFPAFELVVANGGPKLQQPAPGAPPPPARPGFPDFPEGSHGVSSNNSRSGPYAQVRLGARQATMPQLAEMIRTYPNPAPILDKTGLTGKYDFTLEYTYELPSATPEALAQAPPAPDLQAALREQLGLQLVARKLPFPVVAVDSVDKLPSEN